MLVITDEPTILDFKPYTWNISELDIDVIQMINNIEYSMDIVVSTSREPVCGESYVSFNVVYDKFTTPQKKRNVRLTELTNSGDDVDVSIRVAYYGYRLFGVLDADQNQIIVQGFRMPLMNVIAKFTASRQNINDISFLKDIDVVTQSMIVYTDDGAYFSTHHGVDVEWFEILEICTWKRSLYNDSFVLWMNDTGLTIVDKRIR